MSSEFRDAIGWAAFGDPIGDDGPRCICGLEVAVPHRECMALLTPAQRRAFERTSVIDWVMGDDDE